MISIVRIFRKDAELLSTLGRTTLLQSHGHSAPAEVMQAYVDKAFSIDQCKKELEDGNNLFHALYYGDEAVGYTKIILQQPHEAVAQQPVTMMERLYLKEGVFEKGLGQQLLDAAVEISKAAGERGMWLTVWQKNERAIRFYQKHGFKTVGESRFVLTQTHANPTWVMLLTY